MPGSRLSNFSAGVLRLSPLAGARAGIAFIGENKKKIFWLWVVYHVIKGTLTTSLIWIPLLYVYFAE